MPDELPNLILPDVKDRQKIAVFTEIVLTLATQLLEIRMKGPTVDPAEIAPLTHALGTFAFAIRDTVDSIMAQAGNHRIADWEALDELIVILDVNISSSEGPTS